MAKIWSVAEVLVLAGKVHEKLENEGNRATVTWLVDEYDLTDPPGDLPIIDQKFYAGEHGNQEGIRLWVGNGTAFVEWFDVDGEGLGRWVTVPSTS